MSGHVGFVMDKEALWRVFSECFGSAVHRRFGGTHSLQLKSLRLGQSIDQEVLGAK
jgi:hypothetical protein